MSMTEPKCQSTEGKELTLSHCTLSLAVQCIVIGPVCGFVCLVVCVCVRV